MFKVNVGEVDSNIRLFVGLVMMALAFFSGGLLQWLFMIAGFVLVMTSVLRVCPVYLVMNKSTVEPQK
jgi:hypothetical protein